MRRSYKINLLLGAPPTPCLLGLKLTKAGETRTGGGICHPLAEHRQEFYFLVTAEGRDRVILLCESLCFLGVLCPEGPNKAPLLN